MVFVDGAELVVILNYGTESDWVRNVRAADEARVVHRGFAQRCDDRCGMRRSIALVVRVIRFGGVEPLRNPSPA
jgi:hypothetical protein